MFALDPENIRIPLINRKSSLLVSPTQTESLPPAGKIVTQDTRTRGIDITVVSTH